MIINIFDLKLKLNTFIFVYMFYFMILNKMEDLIVINVLVIK